MKHPKNIELIKRKVNSDALIFFNQQLASLIRTRLPLPEGLATISRQMKDRRLKKSVAEMERDLKNGLPLSEAFDRQKEVFPELYASMVKAGEASGNLPGILAVLTEYSHGMWDLQRRIKASVAYPKLLGVFMLFYIWAITKFTTPMFAQVYGGQGFLPAPTRWVIAFSELLTPWWRIILLLGILWLTYYILNRRKIGGRFFDKLKFHIPLYGKLVVTAEMWRFNRTVGILLNTGVPLVEALKLAGAISQNRLVASAIDRIRQGVAQGEKFGDLCKQVDIFPETMTWMIAMAEEQGSLNDTLTELGRYYDLEVELTCERIQHTIGPIIVLILGVIVGFFLLSMYLPVFRMGEVLM